MFSQKIWDFWAGRYQRLWVQKYSLEPTRKMVIQHIKLAIEHKTSCQVLDMGCGTGQLISDMHELFGNADIEYTGVDISPDMIKKAKAMSPYGKYMVSSVDDFYSDIRYDVIVCTHSFPYYPKKEHTIEKFYNLLKDDGMLLLAQASTNNIYDRIALGCVKLTTSKAHYPSVKEMENMIMLHFDRVLHIKINNKPYIPSIYLYCCSK